MRNRLEAESVSKTALAAFDTRIVGRLGGQVQKTPLFSRWQIRPSAPANAGALVVAPVERGGW